MPTIGFSHYNLRAPRGLLDVLRDFYVEVVGLAPGARPSFPNFGYWLYAGSHDVLHLSEADAADVRAVGVKSTFDHVAFACTGRADAEQRLSRHGIDYRVAVAPGTGQVQLFFQDPAGNGVELSFAKDGA
jgi:catechol-2,3-dioxygenase